MHGLRALACLLACIDGMRGMRVLACLLACVLARVFYMRVLVSFHSCAAIFNNSPLVLFGSLPGLHSRGDFRMCHQQLVF